MPNKYFSLLWVLPLTEYLKLHLLKVKDDSKKRMTVNFTGCHGMFAFLRVAILQNRIPLPAKNFESNSIKKRGQLAYLTMISLMLQQ